MSEKARYLHIIASVNPAFGGPVEGIKQIASVTTRLGYRPEVASLDDPQAPYLSTFPLPVHALGPGRGAYGYTPHLVPWLMRHAGEYDGIILNGIWLYSSFGAYQALNRLKKPYVAFTHGMLDPYFKQFRLKHLKKSLYWPWAEYRVLRDANAVCFTSDEERLLARQSFSPYRCQEVVVNYGTAGPPQSRDDIERQRAAFFERWPHLEGKRFLLFLSRIHPKKGCDLLVSAFAAVASTAPDVQLVIAGPDQAGDQAQLEALAQSQGIANRITWTGMLSGDRKWGAFRAAEAFILPSHQENFGIAVAEALSCSLPVLISNKVNIWREISADGAGFVEPDDLAGTTALLQRWLALPPEDREAMSQRALCAFNTRFEIQQAAHSLLNVLRQSNESWRD